MFTVAERRRVLAFLLVMTCVAACGRREKPSAFDATATVAQAASLPPSAIRVKWGSPTLPATLAAGSTTVISVTFTNAGDKVWPDVAMGDPQRRDGAHAVRLGYGWAPVNRAIEVSPARINMPHPVQPGETVTLDVPILAPAQPGEYSLSFDLVQELLFWFSERGAGKLTVPVRVVASH